MNKLMHSDGLRFSQLKPKDLESNVFMYHLKILIKSGYVIKVDANYTLTPKGLSYVDSLSQENLKPRKQPKLIAIVAVKNQLGEYLLLERKFQPYNGQLMLPSGKQHLGEDFEAHAKRELCEKTGLKLDLTFRGTANIIIRENQEVLTHVVAHIHSGISKEIILPPDNDMFNFHLYEQGNKTNAIMPGTSEILKLLETTKSIFVTNLDLN
jgi:ADP-ribose pyrophosphatase YjhB (NUDIX family)